MSNNKFDATFYGAEQQTAMYDQSDVTVIDEVSVADMLCDQLQLFTEEGGNDLQGEYVDEVTLGGRIVTVDWSNGQQFQIEVREVIR